MVYMQRVTEMIVDELHLPLQLQIFWSLSLPLDLLWQFARSPSRFSGIDVLFVRAEDEDGKPASGRSHYDPLGGCFAQWRKQSVYDNSMGSMYIGRDGRAV